MPQTQVLEVQTGGSTLHGRLLAQVGPGEAEDFADLGNAAGGGLIMSGLTAVDAGRRLRDKGYVGPLLMDRQRYRGARRAPATVRFDPDWMNRQRELGADLVLTDSGYVAAGDTRGLTSILDQAAALQGVLAVLPVANTWTYGRGLKELLARTEAFPHPIGLVIEHSADPLGTLRILGGVLELLASNRTVMVLCSDVSAVGLLAHGAFAAGYGSISSLRHLYPIKPKGSRGTSPIKTEAALWPFGMALHYVSRLYRAVMTDRGAPQWDCYCEDCLGLSVDRFLTLPSVAVHRHNYAGLLKRRDEIMSTPSGDRARVWRQWCELAVDRHSEIPFAMPVPPALRTWIAPVRADHLQM